MTRLAILALGVAAVLGVTGGVAAATLTGHSGHPSDDPTAGPSASSSAGPAKPTASTPAADELFYADSGSIHDGARTIALHGPTTGIVALQRTATGYLVTAATGTDQPDQQWLIGPDGSADSFAATAGAADLNQDGTRLVAFDAETGELTVWDLQTGDVVARWPQSSDATGDAVFIGHDVYVNQFGTGEAYDLWRWNPDTGASRKTGRIGLEAMQASPGGAFIAGATGPEGLGSADDGCTSLASTYLKHSSVGWTTCDYRLAGHPGSFSPDGSRLLTVPTASRGRFLRQIVVLDAVRGARREISSFEPPPRTLNAQWAGDDALFVTGSRTTGGTWVARCTLDTTDCVRVVTVRGPVVVGSTS